MNAAAASQAARTIPPRTVKKSLPPYSRHPAPMARAWTANDAESTQKPARAPAPLPKELEDRRKEAEALARFLLENLS